MQYHHTGVVTDQQQPDEVYVEATKVWVTKPEDHPYRIEFLRFESDSPVQPPVRDHCHTAYEVDDLNRAIASKNIVLGPFEALPGLRVVFHRRTRPILEYMDFSQGRSKIS